MQKGFIRVFVLLFLVGFCWLPSFSTCHVASAAEVDEAKLDGDTEEYLRAQYAQSSVTRKPSERSAPPTALRSTLGSA